MSTISFLDSEPNRSMDFSPFRRAYRASGVASGHGSPAARSVQSEVSPLRSFQLRQGQGEKGNSRVFATPPAPRRGGYLPSPKTKPSWVQRHLQRRRPQTVNVDDATLSGKCSTIHRYTKAHTGQILNIFFRKAFSEKLKRSDK